jgi:NAD(P)-dependent dehydrogenase (short-subunit alcohol dehydrogenase family)
MEKKMAQQKWNSENITDQKGRVAIVTGSSSGIGYETARVLAEKNATVIIAVRNLGKGSNAAEKILAEHPKANLKLMYLDLASLKSVRTFSQKFQEEYSRLDLLINNAGVMMPPYCKTEEGYELQFGTNHLGHFLLTGLLLDILKITPGSRIVNVSSGAHNYGNLDFEDLNWVKRKYNPMRAYSDSKIANIYFTYELGRRLEKNGNNPTVTAAHPGWTATELQRNAGGFRFLNPFFAQGIDMGALPTLMAAVDSDVNSGDYFGPSGMMEMRGHPKKVKTNKLSKDEEIAARLWDVSESLIGLKYKI